MSKFFNLILDYGFPVLLVLYVVGIIVDLSKHL